MTLNPRRSGGGSQRRPLLRKDIETAQQFSQSAAEAARYLNVNIDTYKKYATMYGLYQTNQGGKRIKKRKYKGTFGLDSILNGEHPTYDRNKLKIRLIQAGYLEERCHQCGFAEKRVIDGRSPLILNCIDSNYKNLALDNLELLCYNCTYLCTGKVWMKSDHMFAPGVHDHDMLETKQISMDDIAALQDELLDEMDDADTEP